MDTTISARHQDPERTAEMLRLRHQEKWTIQQIGDRYGISRERVRQIIGNTGRYASKYTNTLKNESWLDAHKDKTNNELASMLSTSSECISMYRGKTRHAISPDSFVGYGAAVEGVVSDHLRGLGIENQLMPVRHPFDILAENGARIEVKSRFCPMRGDWHIGRSIYAFNVIKGNKLPDYADFYILVIAVEDPVYFVVPVPDVRWQKSLYVTWPRTYENCKYSKYHNAFDAIRNF